MSPGLDVRRQMDTTHWEEAAASFFRHYPDSELATLPPKAAVWRRKRNIQDPGHLEGQHWQMGSKFRVCWCRCAQPGPSRPGRSSWAEPAPCCPVCGFAALIGRMMVWVMEVLVNSNYCSCLDSQISYLVGCWKALYQTEKLWEWPFIKVTT